jgi:hypothetical protein
MHMHIVKIEFTINKRNTLFAIFIIIFSKSKLHDKTHFNYLKKLDIEDKA